MVGDSAAIVHFPHPGQEHNARNTTIFPWNSGTHRRKFMRSPGAYIDRSGNRVDADLVFWGEWEPPSRVLASWPPDGHQPQYLHEPIWVESAERPKRQNTDPWVFGDAFRYSNCKQAGNKGRALRELSAGSMVLFGSAKDGHFVLDTVLVVADSSPYSPSGGAPDGSDDCFATCTVESLALDGAGHEEFVVHRGATAQHPIGQMYSFTPCQPAGRDGPRFRRPTIELDGYVNPASWQAVAGAGRLVPLTEVERSWRKVVEQVHAAKLELGVWFETPQLVAGPQSGPLSPGASPTS